MSFYPQVSLLLQTIMETESLELITEPNKMYREVSILNTTETLKSSFSSFLSSVVAAHQMLPANQRRAAFLVFYD